MILAIDVGNTTIEIGVIKDHKICFSWRLQTDQGRLADEYGVQICQLLRNQSILPRVSFFQKWNNLTSIN